MWAAPPSRELVVEQFGAVDDDAVEEQAELLGVDAVGALDLAVEAPSHLTTVAR